MREIIVKNNRDLKWKFMYRRLFLLFIYESVRIWGYSVYGTMNDESWTAEDLEETVVA